MNIDENGAPEQMMVDRRSSGRSICRAVVAAGYLAIFAVSAPFQICAGDEPTVVRHKGFDDFSRGSFPDGGANIYVSKSGTIQLIPRWDLNRDGFIDLLINQDENEIEAVDAFIYWGSRDGYQSLFPAFWKETMPAYKLVQAIEKRSKHVAFLPTFGGGPVKLIDLNRDGYVDIVFPNIIHNYSVHMEAYIYWGGPDGYSPQRMTRLPTLFAREVTVADFNRDEHLDIAVANFGNETGDRWGYKNHLESYIYWGGAEGYSADRRTSIPTLSAVSCVAGDFNGDAWPDLAFVNNNLREKSVSVYFGGKSGFHSDKRLQLDSGDPGIVRTGDVNGDKIDDLLVCSRGTGAELFLGAADFSLRKAAATFPVQANDAVIRDLNADGHQDLAVASSASAGKEDEPGMTNSVVYWGAAEGFDPNRRSDLPTLSPRAVAAADLNNDGFAELMFANYSDRKTYDVPSYIYWGLSTGFDRSRRTNLQGFGPVGIAADDLNDDETLDVVLMNQNSGTVDGGVPSVIFWGNPAHFYSEANATLLPAKGPYGSKVADLNDDGFPDVVFTGESACINWGSESGFKKTDWFNFGERVLGVTIGDFNRNGYLDLAFSTFSGGPQKPNEAILMWGSSEGFAEKRSTRIPLQAESSCCGNSTADLNNDGHLDLILPAGESMNGKSQILWGDVKGFEVLPSAVLLTGGVGAPAVADLDGNGWLDLIFPGFQDLKTQDPHCKTWIYWGSKKGFNDSRRTELEAYTSGEIIVADLNADGHLELVSSNYKSNETRSLPIFIFWGSADHKYSDDRRTELPAESSLGMQVLDLNDDGFPDIVVHNHIKDGDHTYGGYIYWGGKHGYSIKQRTHLPIVGPHYSIGINPGNIFDRSDASEFVSPIIDVPTAVRQVKLEWEGETPHKTSIRFRSRAASTRDALEKAAWSSVDPKRPLSLPADARVLQYSAGLASPDGGSSPLLREVVLSFNRDADQLSANQDTGN